MLRMAWLTGLRTEHGLASLDAHLASRSYLYGSECTTSDMTHFRAIPVPDSAFPNVCRWHGHIKALLKRYPLRAWPVGPDDTAPAAAAVVPTAAAAAPAAAKAKAKDAAAPAAKAKAAVKKGGDLPTDVAVVPCTDRTKQFATSPAAGAFCTPRPVDKCKGRFYITTAINYSNGWPHIGHAYEGAVTDVLARFYRAMGRDVYFQTGTDEHGQKIADSATADGVTPLKFCDRYVEGFKCLNQRLGVVPDAFIRTTMNFHKECARELWRRCEKKGDIYLGRYEGWYMVREERFVTDTEATEWNFLDPVSQKPLTRMEESSYFFKLSKYYDRIVALLETPDFVQPKEHRNEVIARIKKEPLRDLSISRTTFDWGVDCPVGQEGGKKHVMYVWFDALTNYLSGVYGLDPKNKLSRFWPADVHVIGKDIAWFHTVIWPAMLWSAEVPIPKSVWVHGFIAGSDGRKMSKSLGNVVNPHDLLDEFTSDSVRWYFVRSTGFGDDLPFSKSQMKLIHNADLCDNLGNLVNRAVKLCGDRLPDAKPVGPFPFDVAALRKEVDEAIANLGVMDASASVLRACAATNKWIADLEPWKMKGADQETRKKEVLRVLAEAVYVLAHFFAPFVPLAGEAIFKKFDAPSKTITELNEFNNLPDGCAIRAGSVLFTPFADAVQEMKDATEKKAAAAADQPLFSKLDIRIGQIEDVWEHPEADRLYVEKINIGGEVRQIVSGLREHYKKDQLKGRKILVVCNIKPRKMKNVESAGMVLCAKTADGTSTVEFVDPPGDGKVGDRITLPGEETWKPVDSGAFQKAWDKVAPELKTDAKRVLCYGGKPVVAPSGKHIVAPTLANMLVS